MDKNKTDPYFKKNISFKYEGQEFIFKVSQELFSSQIIDIGTQRLLRTFSIQKLFKHKKILDLGCGYGPIGIILKKLNPESVVHMVDKDALALEYSRHNVELSKVEDVKVYGSMGYDNVQDKDFDLIVSNIPAKVGEGVLSHMLLDAQFYLRQNGIVVVVVIDAILDEVSNVLKSDDQIEITFQKSWPGHTVFYYKFLQNSNSQKPIDSAFVRGLYDRTDNQFTFQKERLLLKTTYNLPEFDTLSFETNLLLENLSKFIKIDTDLVVVFNPGQGYVPVALSKLIKINKLVLIDRDLQALEVSKRNLILNKFPIERILLLHQVGVSSENKKIDHVIGIVPEKQENGVYEMFTTQSANNLKPGGLFLTVSNSNVMFKVEKNIHADKTLIVLAKNQSKGKKMIVARKKV
ncbi:hypothetical protein BH10PAT1_BH10PAT1_7430 [soil metagenome]